MADSNPSSDVTLEWSEERLPRAFAAAHDNNELLLKSAADGVMDAADVAQGMTVLDVGCGSGIPSLRMAVRVGPSGKVIATDPSPIFVAATEENARSRGLANIETICCSVNALPLTDASVDAATALFSAMFFPDIAEGLRHIRRVMKPGARLGVVGWGPREQNEYFDAFFSVAGPYMPPPDDSQPLPEDHPRPDRFAASGRMTQELKAAGFHYIKEETLRFDVNWSKSPQDLLQTFSSIAGFPEQLPPDQRAQLDREVLTSFERFRDGDTLRFQSVMVLGSGAA